MTGTSIGIGPRCRNAFVRPLKQLTQFMPSQEPEHPGEPHGDFQRRT